MPKVDDNFLTYNALDSACMVEIHDKIWPQVEKDYLDTYNLTVSLYSVLTFMQLKGIKVNQKALQDTKKEVLEKIANLQQELDTQVGHPLNINSSKQCANYFYIELGITPILNKKTKKITTDNLAMQRLARGTEKNPGLPQATLVQNIRGLTKLYNTYLNLTFDTDNRLRGAYNPRGTKFGRLSSSKTVFGTGMNQQNLPQEFKKFLVADEGFMFIEVDKKQAEWVIMAYLANDANMIKAIEEGLDVHVHTASLMFNLPTEIINYENDLIGHITNPESINKLRLNEEKFKPYDTHTWPKNMSLRQCGKKSNHGLDYDEGYKGFALINEMLESESKRIVEMYHAGYPGIRLYYADIKKQLQKNRTLINCFGRKVYFMGEWSDSLLKSAYSMLPQSTVVDSLNMGLVKLYRDSFITDTLNIDILAQVHDSILMQVPIRVCQDKETFNALIEKIYEYISPEITYNNHTFKIATDTKIGFNWGGFNFPHNIEGMRDYNSHEDINKLLTIKD